MGQLPNELVITTVLTSEDRELAAGRSVEARAGANHIGQTTGSDNRSIRLAEHQLQRSVHSTDSGHAHGRTNW